MPATFASSAKVQARAGSACIAAIGVYLLTLAWMFGAVAPAYRDGALARSAVWIAVTGGGREFGCILLQAARGRRSHFNVATGLDAVIYASMGIVAVLFTGAVLPLAGCVALHPRAGLGDVERWSIVGGLESTFLLGIVTGMRLAHAARNGSGEPAAATLTKLAHFLRVHAMQALPALGFAAPHVFGSYAAFAFVPFAVAYVAWTCLVVLKAQAGAAEQSRSDAVRSA